MKQVFLAFLCLFYLLNVHCQESVAVQQSEYNCLMIQGVNSMDNQQYDEAIVYFQKASNICPHYHKPYYFLISCYDHIGDTIQTYIQFEKMILTGTKISVISTYAFPQFAKTSLYSKLLQTEDSLLSIANNRFDQSFIEEMSQLIKLQKQQCSNSYVNLVVLDSLISTCKKYGKFPSALNSPIDLYRRIITLVNYSLSGYDPESERWQEIKKIIIKEFERGGIESDYVATIIDIDLYYRGLETQYGVLNEESFPDMKKPKAETMIKNRVEIGLCDKLLDE